MSVHEEALRALSEARKPTRPASLTFAEQALANAWSSFIAAQRGTYAITLAYKNRHEMTAFEGFKVDATGRRTLETLSRQAGRPYRLPIIRRVTLEGIHADVRHFHGCIDQYLYGPRFHRRPLAQRTSYVGFIEHETTNAHVHLSWHVPDSQVFDFTDAFQSAWHNAFNFSANWIVPITDDGWANYITKARRNIIYGEAAIFLASKSV